MSYSVESCLSRTDAVKIYKVKLTDKLVCAVKHIKDVKICQEAMFLSTFTHPHIMRMYGYQLVKKDEMYIMLEYCSEKTLKDRLSKSDAITEPQALTWFEQIAHAVKCLFSNGILNLKLTVENIYLDEKQNIKLGDFSMKKYEDKAGQMFSSKDNFSSVFIKTYEGLRKQDIWNLGCLFSAILAKETSAQAKVCLLPKSVNPKIDQLIKDMVNKEINKRPDIDDVLAAISEIRGKPNENIAVVPITDIFIDWPLLISKISEFAKTKK